MFGGTWMGTFGTAAMKCVVPECKGLAVYGPRCAVCRERDLRRALCGYSADRPGDEPLRRDDPFTDRVIGELAEDGPWDGDPQEGGGT